MRILSRIILRHAWLISIVGTLLGAVGIYYSALLYMNLRTDFQELLPTTARSVIDLDEVAERLPAIDSLAVLIFSEDTQASKRFVLDLANRLNNTPSSAIASIEYRIDKEIQFFKDREALYMEQKDLAKIRNYIWDRIEYEKDLYNPLTIFRGEEILEPTLDFESLRRKYAGKLSAYDRFPDGFYASVDEKKRVILVYMAGKTGMDKVFGLKKTVADAVATINPSSYAPDMAVKYTGSVQDTIEEHEALIEDLELATVIVIIICTIALLVFFRTIRATLALFASLFIGTFWTFGIAYFVIGYLNANSAFLGSIVIGNGINFGIILLARYTEERRQGRDHAMALTLAMTHTSTSTWTAALAAGLSYGSLMLTSFRGFNQFGVIGLIGMVLCWVSAFTVLPAYLTILDRFRPLVRQGAKAPKPVLTAGIAALVNRFPGTIWAITILLTIVSIGTFFKYSPDILETNLTKIRNIDSLTTGSGYLSRNLDEIFQRYLSPVVLLPKSNEDAKRIADLLREIQKKEAKDTLISSVQVLDDFLPSDQDEKIKLLKQIRLLLPPRLLAKLSEYDQKLVARFLNEASLRNIEVKDLPPMLLNKFSEKDKSVGKMVLVEPPLTNETWVSANLIRFIAQLRDTADSVSPGTAVAGTLPLTSDMILSVSRDGPRATLFAFLAVVALVVLLFRNVRTIALVLFSLTLGVTWLGGLIMGFWLKVNFLNFIALPITFGIGVDYGVNIFQRYREEGGNNILTVIRNTGGAVALCSFTTIVGYGSLLIARNQGFVSFGLLAVAGELTCVIAAIISLPAYLLWRSRRQQLRELVR